MHPRKRRRPSDGTPATVAPQSVELRGEAVGKSFGSHEVLRGVDLEIHAGEMVAIVGLSGSGKTVLLHCLTGLLPVSSGRVLAADHSGPDPHLVDLGSASAETLQRIRLSWSFVFQRNALFSDSVYENCALWLREHTTMAESAIEARVRQGLASAALDVDDVIFKQTRDLSGGMAKRVAVVRAVVSDPVVVFYDEPTTGLDPVTATHLHDLVFAMHHRPRADGLPRTTVLVTHDRDLLRRLLPRVVMLHGAGVCFDGPYEEFATSSVEAVHEYMSSMPALHGRPAT